MDKIEVIQIADLERDQVQRSASPHADEDRQYLAVPYAEREAAKAAGAKWDWREKLWYIGLVVFSITRHGPSQKRPRTTAS